MKKRRGILFALGIVLSLSVAVPAVAAENVTGTTVTQDSVENEQAQEASKENETDAAQIPQIQDEEKTADADGKEKEVTPTWEKYETENGDVWRLKLGESTPPDNDGYARDTVYTNNGNTYYINKDRDMSTGYVKVDDSATDPSADKLEPGLYYFSKEGNDPSADTLGSMLKDCWAQEADENGAWHYLGSDGKAVNTGEKAGWQQPEKDWYYLKEDGTIDTSKAGWVQIENVWMKAGKGVATIQKAGWYQIENRWYMLKNDGSRDTSKVNWQQINGNWYFLKADGSRDTSKTGMQTGINGKTYFLNAEGVPQNGFQTVNGVAYYFDVQAGTARQLGNNWQQMNGSWYWIENGRVATGWRVINGKWYYLNPADGRMLTGFYKDATGQLFYSDGSGAMLSTTGWYLMNGTWYWVNGNGSLATGWINVGGTWYYMGENGAMKTGWYQVKGVWYYSNGSGAMQTGWLNRGGTWYYLTGSGAMATGWINLGGTWYYLNPGNGDMVGAGWHLINNKWYYFGGSGAMYSNRWIGNYYVGGNGEMLTNTWVGSYWVGADGKWIPNYDPDVNANWVKSGNTWYYQRPDGSKLTNSWKRINGSWYYFGADGAMTTGWKYVDGYKFYFGTDGKMVQDVDKLIGKQSSYRITVNRVKCQVTVYAANETGNYCIPVKTFTCSVGKAGTPTHAGTYATLKKQNPVELMGPSWGKYGTQINNYGDWFHSVACSNPDPTYALAAGNYNMLGQPASHGCVRLCVRDAKWIYDNCGLYTRVDISDTEYTPFDKAPTIKIPASQNWDPTDADAKR
ncbi:MAG: L,D-transpeptidase family protein [Lachnospiraceae bacterium]|nr:L,D-transpeptidase family protein [Lachnospiraceae bacterium]